MGSASDTYENKILDAIFGDNRATALFPTPVYIVLFTATPSDSAFGTEVTGGNYSRPSYANTGAAGGTNWPTAASSQKKNGVAIAFPTASASWGTVTSWGIADHATTQNIANIIVWGALASGVLVNSGDTPSFAINQLVIGAD